MSAQRRRTTKNRSHRRGPGQAVLRHGVLRREGLTPTSRAQMATLDEDPRDDGGRAGWDTQIGEGHRQQGEPGVAARRW